MIARYVFYIQKCCPISRMVCIVILFNVVGADIIRPREIVYILYTIYVLQYPRRGNPMWAPVVIHHHIAAKPCFELIAQSPYSACQATAAAKQAFAECIIKS